MILDQPAIGVPTAGHEAKGAACVLSGAALIQNNSRG
jgi:hypothetical protein